MYPAETPRLTGEQTAIIDAARAGSNLVVTAGAGCGKTSTTREMTRAMRGRGLYVAFNKSVQREAEASFPRHVQTRTAHSLAYRAMGKHYDRRRHAPAQTGAEVAAIVGLTEGVRFDEHTLLSPSRLGSLAASTVEQFCCSAESEITAQHVPHQTGISEIPEWHRELARLLVPAAQRAWENLQVADEQGGFDPQDPSSYRGWIKAKHSHYLKQWALTRPTLDVDFVCFDEAQDADPCVRSVLLDQQTQLVAVGDSAQQLYGWRNAVDALADWPADQRLTLSESFRFGQDIADEANLWLDELDAELRLTGRGPEGVIGDLAGWPDAILCRTNAGALGEALSALSAGKRTAISGGGRAIREMAEAAQQLQQGQPSTHPELCVFTSWSEVQAYVEAEADAVGELAVFVKLVDTYTPELLIQAVDRLVADRPFPNQRNFRAPDVLISTGHKAKGLQWPRVRIAGDFAEPAEADGEPAPIPPEMAMLAYVAVTRAEHHLAPGGLDWIHQRQSSTTQRAA